MIRFPIKEEVYYDDRDDHRFIRELIEMDHGYYALQYDYREGFPQTVNIFRGNDPEGVHLFQVTYQEGNQNVLCVRSGDSMLLERISARSWLMKKLRGGINYPHILHSFLHP